MNRDIQAAKEIIAAVDLVDVRLAQAGCKSSVRSVAEIEEPEFHISRSAKLSKEGLKDGVFYVLASLQLTVAASAEDQGRELVSIRAQYEIKYRVPRKFATTQKALKSFANINGLYNAWPYFREFVQTTTQRMDLPGIVLPVYRISTPRAEKNTARAEKRGAGTGSPPLLPPPANDNGEDRTGSTD